MSNLDDKFLNGPNVGYCSDSDEDETTDQNAFKNVNNESNADQINSKSSTGPKGVLADYHLYQKQKILERQKSEIKLINEAKRFTLEEAGNKTSEDDSDELNKIRQKRLEQLKLFCQSRIVEIPSSSEFLSVIEKNSKHYVFIHIYRDGLEVVQTLNEALLELAGNYKKLAKFFKIKVSVLKTSVNFEANALPVLQIYKNGNLIGNFIRMADELGEDFTSDQLKKFLEKHNINFDYNDYNDKEDCDDY